MNAIIPRITVEGREVDYLRGTYANNGGLTAATLQFTLPLISDGYKNLWNKEVLFYANDFESKPLFRGYIKRVKEDFDTVEVFAQDVIGYMVLGGDAEKAKIALTDKNNLDGLTVGAAIRKAINMANLNNKISTDFIGDTTPIISSSRPPLRGTKGVLDIIKELMGRAIDDSVSPPRPNLLRVVDDGSTSQLVIDVESDLDSTELKHVFTEYDNITDLKIIKRKVPTILIVNGKNEVSATFSHDSAIAAYDRNYLEVNNDALESPAACKDFAQKLFRANLTTQYEYGIDTFEGVHLEENDVIRVDTEDDAFSGNYRVRGKRLQFDENNVAVGITINRKPPTLSEYIARQDN